MKTILPLLLLGLFPILATAADEAAEDAALLNLAVTKREAVLEMSFEARNMASYGAFISKDGLALVDMACLALNEKPETATAAGTPLEFPKILGTFPEQELALVKFNHQPKAYLKLAAKEPEVADNIALVTINVVSARFMKTPPPVVGLVMAKRSMVTTRLRQALFTRVLSFGSGMSAIQMEFVGAGRFAINLEGELVAFTGRAETYRGQNLIFLLPVAALAGRIEDLAKAGKDLGHPFPADENPYDMALLDADSIKLEYASRQGEMEKARAALDRLHNRYPKSTNIRLMAANWTVSMPGNPLQNPPQDLAQGDPSDSKANQVRLLSARADELAAREDFEGVIAIRKAAIALSPDDYVKDRLLMAAAYGNLGRLAEAQKHFDECYKFAPEMILLARFREMTLLELKEDQAAQLMTDRIAELEEIYRER